MCVHVWCGVWWFVGLFVPRWRARRAGGEKVHGCRRRAHVPLAAGRFDLGLELVEVLQSAGGPNNLCALLRKEEGGVVADPARRPGDDRDFPRKRHV